MNLQQFSINIKSSGRSFINITEQIAALLNKTKIETGLCQVFLRHTSASLILCENADPNVLIDLENYMRRLVHDGDQHFKHIAEGPDDMPAHIRSVLTANSLTIPFIHQVTLSNLRHGERIVLGAWHEHGNIFIWDEKGNKELKNLPAFKAQ